MNETTNAIARCKTGRLKASLVIAAMLAALFPTTTVSHEGATGIVKARMDLMESLRNSVKILATMHDEKIPHQPEVVQNEARWIASQAQRIAKLFPKGSRDWPSVARPEIWQDWAAFRGLAEQLAKEGDQLAARAASASLSETTADFRALIGVCGSCHKRFRETR